jgi:hypothetical protein
MLDSLFEMQALPYNTKPLISSLNPFLLPLLRDIDSYEMSENRHSVEFQFDSQYEKMASIYQQHSAIIKEHSAIIKEHSVLRQRHQKGAVQVL